MAGKVCFDKARRYGVAGDVAGGYLFGYGLGEGDESGFGSGVVGLPRQGNDAGHAGHVDYASPTLLDHWPQGSLGAEEGALQVDVHYLIPGLFAHEHDQGVVGGADVVHEDVQLAEGVQALFEEPLDIVGSADIRPDDYALALLGLDGAGHFFGGFFVCTVVDDDFGALFGELDSYGAANA